MAAIAIRTATVPEIDQDAVGRRALEIRNRWPSVGFAPAVVAGRRLRFFHGGGLADVDSGTPITQDTVFRFGSMTKTFVALSVMQLCEQGLLDLDAPVHD